MSIGDFPESLSQAMLVGCNVSREIGRSIDDNRTAAAPAAASTSGRGPLRSPLA